MRIGLLGMGTIGSGVYEIVAKRADMEIARVLDLRPIPGLGGKLTTRFEDILEDKTIDTVVELMGGLEPAHEFVVRALRAGKSVVTANKLMLSHHTRRWRRPPTTAARARFGQRRRGIPYLHNLLCARRGRIKWVGGRSRAPPTHPDTTVTARLTVLREAQRLGCRGRPSSDIDGIDAFEDHHRHEHRLGGVADTREVTEAPPPDW
ncbi:MAG: hypothetical protein ACLUE1_04375 [Adlercreutzia equolifaciens]